MAYKSTRKATIYFQSKRIVAALLAFLLIAVVALYLLTPSQMVVSKTILIGTNQKSLSRLLSDDVKRDGWWAAFSREHPANAMPGTRFRHDYLGSLITVSMIMGSDTISGEMRIIPAGNDSSYVKWQLARRLSSNLFRRTGALMQKNALKQNMQAALLHLKIYAAQTANVYGFPVSMKKVKDTLIAVIRSVGKVYPSMDHVYEQVAQLRKFTTGQQARATNYPMLFVQKTGEDMFETMIGLPVDKAIDGSAAVVLQHMIPGDILFTLCKGGPSKITSAFRETMNYMHDYGYSSPALPFELLITDRLLQPDTSQWITGIFYPVY